MIFRSILLAAILIFGSLAVAGAQSMGGYERVSGGQISTADATTQAAVLGWNYVHATNCFVTFDGSNTWLYVYPQEGGFWFTANPTSQMALTPACQTGNWVGFNVTSVNPPLWNGIFTFTFK